MSIIIFIIMLLVLVIIHEAGHFFAAKFFGIRVDEFGFGFPPKLFGKKFGETEYSLNLIPLGGFVKIFGENPEVEQAHYGAGPHEDKNRNFQNKPAWQQAIVLFAGVFMNFILAWALFSVGFMTGLPTSVGSEPAGSILTNVHLVVTSVLPKSPAENAGLKSGDKIDVFYPVGNDHFYPTVNADTLKSFVLSNGNKEIEIVYLRGKNDEIHYAKLTPVINKINNEPEIGISMDEVGVARVSFFRAIGEGLSLTWYWLKTMVAGIYGLIRDSVHGHGSLASFTGPVGLVGIVGDAYKFGFVYLMSLAALISVNLSIINLIPFPALDGGRLLFLLIEKIKGSRMNPKVINMVNNIGFVLLLLLMAVVTYHDIIKLF